MSAHSAGVPIAELEGGRIVPCALGRDAVGRPIEALVLRDGSGVVRAYRNLCKHLPIPLDAGSRRFEDVTGTHLLCGTHGAVFAPDTGICVEGPCPGARLEPLRVERDGDGLIVTWPS